MSDEPDKLPSKVIVHARRQRMEGFFNVSEIDCQFERFDGSMSDTVTRLVLDRGDAVAAVVIDTDTDELILTRQFRLPAHATGHGWMIEIAAGLVDDAAAPEEEVAREMEEEIGYRPASLRHLMTYYSSPGGTSERVFLYEAKVSEATRMSDGGGLDSEDEDIQILRMSRDEARRALQAGEIVDSKTIIALQAIL